MTLQEALPPGSLAPGKYRLEIKATDTLANQTVSRSTEFTITPVPGGEKTAAEASPTR
jgi:hypothetical protein